MKNIFTRGDKKKYLREAAKFFAISTLIFVWTFSGLAQISMQVGNYSLQFPPSVPHAYAADTVLILTSSQGGTWTVPPDFSNTNTIEVIGAGGGGGNGGAGDSNNAGSGGGGGGGGGYTKVSNVSLTPGASINIQIGTGGATSSTNGSAGGDTYFNRGVSATTTCSTQQPQSVCAKGGGGGATGVNNGAGGNAGASGAASGAVGTTVFSGGGGSAGGTFTSGNDGGSGGGAGGGAGGTTADGSTGGAAGASAGTSPGGAGGAGGGGGNDNGGSSGSSGAAGNLNGGAGGVGGDGTVWTTAGAGGGGGGGGANGRNGTAVAGAGGRAGNYGAGGGGGGGGGRGSGAVNTGGAAAKGADGVIVITYTPAAINLQVSGTLYSDEGVTPITTAGKTIKMAVGTSTVGLYSTTTCAGCGGVYRFTIVSSDIWAGAPIVTWIDNDPTLRASSFTKASSTLYSIVGDNLFQDRVIVKHEGTSATSTLATDMDFYDGDNDSDIQYRYSGGAFSVAAGEELHIWTGDTFIASSTVTLYGNAGSGTDGSLHIDDNASFTPGGNMTLAGNWAMDTGASFVRGIYTTTFNATSSGKTITGVMTVGNAFNHVTFNGSGGAWTFSNNASTTDLTVTNGSVTAPAIISVIGNFTNNGTYDGSGSLLIMSSSTAQTLSGTLSGNSTLGSVQFTGTGSKTFSAAASTTNFTVIAGSRAVLPSSQITVAGNFSSAGTVSNNNGTIFFTGTSNSITAGSSTLSTVYIDPSSAGTITLNDKVNIAGALVVASGDTFSLGASAFATSTSAGSVTINGTISGSGLLAIQHSSLDSGGTLNSSVRFDASAGDITAPARTYGGMVEIYGNNSSFQRAVVLGAGDATFSSGLFLKDQGTQTLVFDAGSFAHTNITVTDIDFTGVGVGTEVIWSGPNNVWTVSGNVDLTNGNYVASSTNSFVMTGSSKTFTPNSQIFANLTLSGTITLTGSLSLGNLTATGDVTLSGTVSAPNQTITMNGSGVTLEGGGNTIRALAITSGGNVTLSNSDITVGTTTIANGTTLTIGAGRNYISTSTLTLTGTLGGTGTTTFGSASFACPGTPSTGTLNVNIRVDATGGNCSMSARTYGANVEIYSNSAASTRTVTMGAGTHTISGSLLVNAANTQTTVLDANSPTLNVSGDLYFIGNGSGQENMAGGGANWTIAGNVNINGGVMTATSKILSIGGNFTNTTGTFSNNTGTTTFSGSAAQTINAVATGTSAFNNLEFSGAGTKTLPSAASSTNFFINSGSGAVIAPSGNLSVSRNYRNDAIYTHNSGTVVLNGPTVQSLDGAMTGSSAFNNLTITNTSATTTFESASETAGTFTATRAGTHIAFPAGATTTMQTLVVNGQGAGNEVRLWSTSPGNYWYLDAPGSRSVSYTDVMDSSACSAAGNIDATDGTNIDSGHNRCWNFTVGSPTISSDADQNFTVGDSSHSIEQFTVTDTSVPQITAANDLRIAVATSSVGVTWNVSDVTANFGGTASGKVSNPVSFEGSNSVLVIPVDSNFSADDTLTVSGLYFDVSPSTANAPASGLMIYKDGPGDIVSDGNDDKTITVKGRLAKSIHSAGQAPNALNIGGTTLSNADVFNFRLAPTGENVSISSLVVSIPSVHGFVSSDLTNARLFVDYNSSKSLDAGETQVGGAGAVNISGGSGTIAFSSSFNATTTRDYIVLVDFSGVAYNDDITFSLPAGSVTASGALSTRTIVPSGALDVGFHYKPSPSSGDAAPAGQGIVGGGSSGGGSGDSLGSEVGFNAPSASGSPLNEWTSGTNAYASDNAYVTATSDGSREDYASFGFTVPSGNVVDGIEVKLEASGSTAAGTIGVEISRDGGSSYTTTGKVTSALSTNDAVYRIGGASDLWGLGSWNSSHFSNGNFRLRVIAHPSGNTVHLDALQVKAYHHTGGGGGGGGSEVLGPKTRYMASASLADDSLDIMRKALSQMLDILIAL